MELSTRFPDVFPSRALLDRNSTPKQEGIPSTLLYTPLCTPTNPKTALHSLGRAGHLILYNHSR